MNIEKMIGLIFLLLGLSVFLGFATFFMGLPLTILIILFVILGIVSFVTGLLILFNKD